MNMTDLLERVGEGYVLVGGGLVIGAMFRSFAQRSRFCLRAAVIEFWRAQFGEKLSVWLLAFATAVVTVQLLVLTGVPDSSSARQIAACGSLSEALVGGLLFGAGMIMTRGCASRLLVLLASGNLRALLSGLIFAVAAQAALSGALAPLRETISGLVGGGAARPAGHHPCGALERPCRRAGLDAGCAGVCGAQRLGTVEMGGRHARGPGASVPRLQQSRSRSFPCKA